jgi:hypothetical protein
MISQIHRTEIQIETYELRVLRAGRGNSLVYCEHCDAMVAAVTREQAAEFFELNEVTLLLLIETERCHFVETSQPASAICARSLMQRFVS